MNLYILESKKIENRTWYLCKGNLLEYIESLKEDFYKFAIQRKIVKNQYLDGLYTTIQAGDPIPTITLTYASDSLDNIKNNTASINLENTEILDGLQRTFRLWAYNQIAKEYKSKQVINYRDFAKQIKSDNPLFFDSGVISTRMLKAMIDSQEIENIQSVFSKFDIYFTIWTGLSEKEVIKKMLVLNAGQKSVSKTHQFELLFLHFYDDETKSVKRPNGLPITTPVQLFREKDPEANNIKKGARNIGDFMFSTIIVTLQSFVEEKPLRVSTEKLITFEFDENETKESIYDIIFNHEFLLFYLEQLFELDKLISDNHKGKEWFSKDTTLSGVFAAIGKMVSVSTITTKADLHKKTEEVFNILQKQIKDHGFNLENFTEEYNVLSSRSVNIGTFIRKVIMEYTLSLIKDESPNWKTIFNVVKEKK